MRLVSLIYVTFIDYVPFVLSLPLTTFGGGPKGSRSSGLAVGGGSSWLGLLFVFRPFLLFKLSFSLLDLFLAS